MPVRVTRQRRGIWYAGGTVRVGKAVEIVPEYSTGCADRATADHVAATRDAEVRSAIIAGPAGRARRITVTDALTAYIDRPGGVRSYDAARILEFNKLFGDRPLSEVTAGWQQWLSTRGAGQQPSSVARWRAVLQAAINHGATALDAPAPRLSGVRGAAGPERAVCLPDDQRRQLLAAYNAHAACPVLLLAYQGMRTQEALRLDWRHVSLTRRSIHVPADQAKTSKARTIPMHPRVDALLYGLWHAAGQPSVGVVFRSTRGEPYADTRGRGDRAQGGNPLTRAHLTACAAAGVTEFRVHDWRHDWAARFVMAGGDLRTLMELGGWSSLRMVQRYAWVTPDHAAEAIRRIG